MVSVKGREARVELWFVIPSELYTATHEGLSPELVSKDNQGEN